MILADKIMLLRKQEGWSQEELAERLNVSRQAVSKWESAASAPDLDKILLLSRLFGVTTDELLKDEVAVSGGNDLLPEGPRSVKLEDAHEFLALREATSTPLGLAVSLCILSPVPLLALIGLAEANRGISEDLAGGVGVVTLLILIAAAVAIFIVAGAKLSPYEYLEKEPFALTYGVAGMAEEKKRLWTKRSTRDTVIGVCICILSSVPLLMTGALGMPESAILFCVCLLLLLVALAVFLFVRNGMLTEGCDILLQTGSYSEEEKSLNKSLGKLNAVYWPVVTAIYLGYSLITMRWESSWMIWPVAGLLYCAIAALWKLRREP